MGVRAEFNPEDRFPVTGQCVHKFAMAAGEPETLYQRNHCGVYRSDDGSETWQEITGDLPTEFGFSMVTHPRDAETAWVIPLSTPEEGRYMPDGHAAVWRSARPRAPAGIAGRPGCPRRTRSCRSCARRWPATRSIRSGSLRDEHRPAVAQLGRGRVLADDHRQAARDLGRRGRGRRGLTGVAMVMLPRSLLALFPGVDRRHEVAATTVGASHRRRSTRPCPGSATGSSRPARGSGRTSTCSSTASRATWRRPSGAGSVVHVIPAVSGGDR